MPTLIYLGSSILMLAIYFRTKRLSNVWLIGVLGAFISWVSLLSWGQKVVEITFPWSLQKINDGFKLLFVFDKVSWGYAVAISVLVLVALFLKIERADEKTAYGWITLFGLAGVSILSVVSGSLFTFVFTWTLVSIVNFGGLMLLVDTDKMRETAVQEFFSRLGSIFFLIVGLVFWKRDINASHPIIFQQGMVSILILAVGLRLGVLPPHKPFQIKFPRQESFDVVWRLIPLTASMVFISRFIFIVKLDKIAIVLLVGIFLTVFCSVISWVRARGLKDGWSAWIFVLSALMLMLAISGMGNFVSVFGSALLFLGEGVSRIGKWIVPIGLVELTIIPAWVASDADKSLINLSGLENSLFKTLIILVLIVLTFGLLMFGYLKKVMERASSIKRDDQKKYVALFGLLLIPFSHLIVLIRGYGKALNSFGLISMTGVLVLLLGGFFYWFNLRFQKNYQLNRFSKIHGLFSMEWAYRLFKRIFLFIQTILDKATMVMEGDAGFLWAVLIVALFFAMFVGK